MEKVQGQEIITTEQKVEVYKNDIDLYVQEYAEEHKLKDSDLHSMTQNRWNSVLFYIYDHVFKPLKSDVKRYNENSNIDYSNQGLIDTVCDMYIRLCSEYEKEISVLGFSKMTGITTETIYAWNNGPETQRGTSGIVKKLATEREASLSDKLVSGKINPVGVLGVLNRYYGWNMGQPRGQNQRQKNPDIPGMERKYLEQRPDQGEKQQPPEPEF